MLSYGARSGNENGKENPKSSSESTAPVFYWASWNWKHFCESSVAVSSRKVRMALQIFSRPREGFPSGHHVAQPSAQAWGRKWSRSTRGRVSSIGSKISVSLMMAMTMQYRFNVILFSFTMEHYLNLRTKCSKGFHLERQNFFSFLIDVTNFIESHSVLFFFFFFLL